MIPSQIRSPLSHDGNSLHRLFSHLLSQDPAAWSLLIMNKMKNFKRRFSLSVPRTETIEESLAEFTEQFNQLHNRRHHEGEGSAVLPQPLPPPCNPPGPSLSSLTHCGPSTLALVGEYIPLPPAPQGREARRGADAFPSQTCSSIPLAETPSQSPAPSPRQTVGTTPGSRPLACSSGGRTSAASPWR